MTTRVSSGRPAIVVLRHPAVVQVLVDGVLAGCEEEGVPVVIQTGTGTATDLARAAAEESLLFVGVGIGESGGIAVHEQRLAARPPFVEMVDGSVEVARVMGSVAGRLVKGKAMKSPISNSAALPCTTTLGSMHPRFSE